MENEESVLITKQELLKTEIIDRYYDKEIFLNYCIARKVNGDDLSNWSIEELKEIIEKFQKEFKAEIKHSTQSIVTELKDFDSEIDKLDVFLLI
jgi:hypothetical protein